MEETLKISSEEWMSISKELEQHHGVFYKLWQMGKPVFTEDVPTAAVRFDELGEWVEFVFNPNFWKNSKFYDKLFVICHECLHVLLNHGQRIKDFPDKQACNIALDIVVNHLLVRSYGFVRKNLTGWEHFCWVDTVFKNKSEEEIKDDECFEYYINQFEKTKTNPFDLGGVGTVDEHKELENSGNHGSVFDKLDAELGDGDKESLEPTLEKHGYEIGGTKAGDGTGGVWEQINKKKVVKKKNWETIIKKWSLKYLLRENKDKEQWARLNRRFQFLPSDLFLPSEMEIEEVNFDKNRIKVFFFLDTSGSCWNLKDRFFHAAESLPKERFDIRLFCFDTKVQETDLASRKVYGGGTSFSIIEQFIQKDKKNNKYPEAVFVITDGMGNSVTPEQPRKWYWFLSSKYKNCIPKESHVFNLKDFE